MRPSKKPVVPGPGQESVWDYPRPPRLEPTDKPITIVFHGETIVETRRAYRVLETSHPPVYYIPPEDVKPGVLRRTVGQSFCEWKGLASYYDLTVDGWTEPSVAWGYDEPTPPFVPIKGYVAFYAGRVDACYVDGERVTPQPGDFYGGWVTSDIVGPFKGEPGTGGW